MNAQPLMFADLPVDVAVLDGEATGMQAYRMFAELYASSVFGISGDFDFIMNSWEREARALAKPITFIHGADDPLTSPSAFALGGGADLSAGYAKVEALSRFYATADGGLWAVLTASGMWGKADMTRNYLNGGAIDSSLGSTDASGYGLRGRLQWENAIPFFSPYADLSYSRGCFDAYSETGGGFPAAFDKLCDQSTELRYGFDVTYPVTDVFRLIGTVEGVHRFEDHSANVTGQVLGLYAFDLGSVTYQQDWLRAGAGFEADIGPSTFLVMGNATTQSDGPNAWIAANWRVTF